MCTSSKLVDLDPVSFLNACIHGIPSWSFSSQQGHLSAYLVSALTNLFPGYSSLYAHGGTGQSHGAQVFDATSSVFLCLQSPQVFMTNPLPPSMDNRTQHRTSQSTNPTACSSHAWLSILGCARIRMHLRCLLDILYPTICTRHMFVSFLHVLLAMYSQHLGPVIDFATDS